MRTASRPITVLLLLAVAALILTVVGPRPAGPTPDTTVVDSSAPTGSSTPTTIVEPAPDPAPSSENRPEILDPAVTEDLARSGRSQIIIRLRTTGGGDDQARTAANRAAVDALVATLPPGSFIPPVAPSTIPVVTMEVDSTAFEILRSSAQVATIESNIRLRPASLSSSTVIGAQRAVAEGWTGSGRSVAIVDTGVSSDHPFLMDGTTSRTTAEACFSTTSSATRSTCPGGSPMSVDDHSRAGWGQPCDLTVSEGCGHGTAVAGTAVGGTGTTVPTGVAPGARIVSVKVFGHDIDDPSRLGASLSDVNLALQWLYLHRSEFPGLASVNLSLGSGRYTTECGSSSVQFFIHQLATVGIATIASAGNEGFNDAVAIPACAPDAIAVAAIDDLTAARAGWSNLGPKVALFAPGAAIVAPRVGGGFMTMSGTSLAAPAVAGAWATVRQRFPTMELGEVLDHLRSTGTGIISITGGPIGRYDVPLVRVDLAMRPPVTSEEMRPRNLTPVNPARVMDTRRAPTIDSLWSGTGALRSGEIRTLRVTGRAYVPSHGVGSVALTVTVTGPSAPGFLTVFPTGAPRPTASNLNFDTGALVSNMVTVPVDADGRISIFNASGSTAVVVDVLGWFPSDGDLRPVNPARLMDTRDLPTIDGRYRSTGAFGPGESRSLTVTGRGGVPASGVEAVALNLTVAGSTRNGFVTVHPTGTVRPTASNLNVSPGRIVANMIIVPVGARGQVQLFNADGRTQLVVDVLGWFPSSPTVTPLTPARLLDTRALPTVDGRFRAIGPLLGGGDLEFVVTGRGGVPATGATAVALNVTVVDTETAGFVTLHPSGTALPGTSTVNFTGGSTLATATIVPIGSGGRISIHNQQGRTHVVVDVLAWFG